MNSILDNNIILIPLSMLMMNLTGPIIQQKVPRPLIELLELPIIEPFIFIFIMYVAVRKFWVSLILAVIVYIVMKTLMNEKSAYYILPKRKTSKKDGIIDKSTDILSLNINNKNQMYKYFEDKKNSINQYRSLMNSIY